MHVLFVHKCIQQLHLLVQYAEIWLVLSARRFQRSPALRFYTPSVSGTRRTKSPAWQPPFGSPGAPSLALPKHLLGNPSVCSHLFSTSIHSADSSKPVIQLVLSLPAPQSTSLAHGPATSSPALLQCGILCTAVAAMKERALLQQPPYWACVCSMQYLSKSFFSYPFGSAATRNFYLCIWHCVQAVRLF